MIYAFGIDRGDRIARGMFVGADGLSGGLWSVVYLTAPRPVQSGEVGVLLASPAAVGRHHPSKTTYEEVAR